MSVFLALLLAASAGGDGLRGSPAASAIAPPLPHPTYPSTPAVSPPPFAGQPQKPNLLNTLEIFNSANYPFWAVQMGQEGAVRVEVQVSAAGMPMSCRVTEPSGFELLDLGTCDLIMGHGQFTPARDKTGRAVTGILTRTIHWTLPPVPPMPLEDGRSRLIYVIDDKLQVSNCRVEQTPPAEFDPRLCAEMRPVAQMMVASSPDDFEWDHWQVVLDTSGFVGAGTASSLVGKGKKQKLFNRSIVRMAVTPEGKIRRCEFIENGTLADSLGTQFLSKEQMCSKAMKDIVFLPATDRAERLVTLVTAIYLEKKF